MQFRNQAARRVARIFRFGRRQPRPEQFIEGNSLRLQRAGSSLFERMLDAIQTATHSVWLEMYWIEDDELGRRFLDALASAASRGLDVRLLYDAVGSYGMPRSRFATLRAAGVHVVEFNPLQPLEERFHLAGLTLRDHRKLLIVDHTRAFTGGANLAAVSLEVEHGGKGWRDDVVEIVGPVVPSLSAAVADSWRFATGKRLPVDAPASFPQPGARPGATAPVAVLTQGAFPHRRLAHTVYLLRLASATRRVYVANAYFVPEGRLARALVRAARRGVDVRILCPGRSDVPIVGLASRHTWERLLVAGVRIFEWTETVFHSKTACMDGEWATLGSVNLDRLSLRNNRELNVSVLDREFAAEVEAAFLQDCGRSTEVQLVAFRARSWGQRLLEWVAYRLRAWL